MIFIAGDQADGKHFSQSVVGDENPTLLRAVRSRIQVEARYGYKNKTMLELESLKITYI